MYIDIYTYKKRLTSLSGADKNDNKSFTVSINIINKITIVFHSCNSINPSS
jgi:hypothetical protein